MPKVDLIIFGGGVAGLWTLNEASRRGYRCILLEAFELGSGQTIASQGIIHGGLKYTLQGMMTGSARGIREMPLIWRNALKGEAQPDLSDTEIRSHHCYLWRTDSVSSRLGMFGAKMGLRVAPQKLSAEETPELLAQCPGSIAVMEEQVISPQSLVVNLSATLRDQIIKYDPEQLSFLLDEDKQISSIQIPSPDGDPLTIKTAAVLLTAGRGNEPLRTLARQQPGSENQVMQKRPLHMILVRGALPQFNGHCVDGAKTRITITSDTDSQGRTVWQLGGQVSETGVKLNRLELIQHAARELSASIPGINLSGLEWNTYSVDRAEGATKSGLRPETPQILKEGNLLTSWPTKLALAPRLATDIFQHLDEMNVKPTLEDSSWKESFSALPRPLVAQPLWETAENWVTLGNLNLLEDVA
ncbi:FAD-dependent oxidoreductase [Gimesia aquarii]|uniref:Glycerol-3-phosphate dehydrogenase n=1 Tax=Gimesia aquarii TaxID=2527964 RepID=A0A517VNL8_9PLAN|nr:FAD-dependent oxidoreductase [Gimesia aquarii]QDT94589.1 glycerol-3-phosphate dehydrogenase [Gimesia aquarii]